MTKLFLLFGKVFFTMQVTLQAIKLIKKKAVYLNFLYELIFLLEHLNDLLTGINADGLKRRTREGFSSKIYFLVPHSLFIYYTFSTFILVIFWKTSTALYMEKQFGN